MIPLSPPAGKCVSDRASEIFRLFAATPGPGVIVIGNLN
jgi:hypothetical protein